MVDLDGTCRAMQTPHDAAKASLRGYNRVRFLTEEEEKKLRDIIIEKKWTAHLPELDLAISTGLHKGNQYALRWDMVD